MSAYYNENDAFVADWLEELVRKGHIAAGDVDRRSINEVQGSDLDGYTQCHFFAGIGGWSYALRLAGWADDEPVWTGSCPCQPFSTAGRGGGTDDERHLWPEFYRLISERRPATVFGEQVASKAGLGWLDGVFADLEGSGYTCGASDLCAAGVGAPHIRQRLFWLGHTGCVRVRGEGSGQDDGAPRGVSGKNGERERVRVDAGAGGGAGPVGVAISECWRREQNGRCKQGRRPQEVSGWEANQRSVAIQADPGHWGDYEFVRCVEPTKEPGRFVEKWRRVQPGTFPLAHGVPARVGRLRGYGNAIVPQVAAEFVTACVEAMAEIHDEMRGAA